MEMRRVERGATRGASAADAADAAQLPMLLLLLLSVSQQLSAVA